MEQEQKKEVQEVVKEDEKYQEYIDTIKNLKANSISLDEYEKLKEEKSALIASLAAGEKIETNENQPHSEVDIKKLAAKLSTPECELNNLEYVKAALEYRDAVKEKSGVDVFLPQGHQVSATDQDIESVDELIKTFQHCIDYAEGDSAAFTNELQRLLEDDPSLRMKRR